MMERQLLWRSGPNSRRAGQFVAPSLGSASGNIHLRSPLQTIVPFLVDQRIDFLKLDIEGSEWIVLREIAAHLHRVDAIYLEVHQTRDSLPENSVNAITGLLRDAGFQIEVQPRYQQFALPDRFEDWARQAQPQQTQLFCWR
ncbi:MAG: FkbM family methyltransferase [Pirellulaceae bacterium]